MFRLNDLPSLSRARVRLQACPRAFSVTLLLLTILTSRTLFAACPQNTFYWILGSGSGNWSTAGNWSNSSGGATCNGVPYSSATVVFDGRGKGNCNINQAITISSMTISTSTVGGYNGTVATQNNIITISTNFVQNNGVFTMGSSSISVGGSWTVASPGNFIAGTSSVTFNSTTGGRSITSAGRNFNSISFTGSGGTWILQDSMTVVSTITLNNGTFSTNTNWPIGVGGGWLNTGGNFLANSSTVCFTGSNQYVRTRGNVFRSVAIGTATTGGYITLLDSMTVGNLTINASNALELAGLGVANSSAVVMGELVIRGTETVNINPSLVTGSTVTYNATSGSPLIYSSWTYYNLKVSGTNGSFGALNPITINGDITLDAGTMDMTNNSSVTLSGSWYNTGGTFSAHGSTVAFAGSASGKAIKTRGNPFNYALVSGAGTWVLQDSMTVVSTMTLTAGTLDTSASNHALLIGGSWWNTGTNFIANTSTVTFTGTTRQKLRSNGKNFGTLQINGSGGTYVMQDSMTVVDDLLLTAGALDATASNQAIFLQGSWTATTNGNFLANASTVTFNTSGTNSITSAGKNFSYTLFNGAGSYVLQDSMTVTSTMTLTAGTLDTSASNLALSIGGSWWNSGATFTANSSTVTFTGITQLKVRTNGSSFGHVVFNGTGATWTMQDPMTTAGILTLSAGTLNTSASNLALSVGDDWMSSGGNFVANASTVTFTSTGNSVIKSNGKNFSYVQMNGSGSSYWALADSMTVTSSMTLTAGTLDTTSSNQPILLGGSWYNPGGHFIVNNSTVSFTATTAAQRIFSGGDPFGYVFFNGAGGTWVLQDSMTVVSTMTLLAGTLNTNAAGNFPIWLGGTWWNTGGTFTANGSTVSLTGLNQQIRSRANAFRNVSIGTNTTGGYVTLFDPLTVTGLNVNAGNTLRTKGLGITISSGIIGGELVVSGTETITNIPALLIGSTVTYTVSGGVPVIFTTWTYQNLQVNGSGFTYQAKGQLTVNQDLSILAGTLDMLNSSSVTLRGSWSNTGGNFTARTSTVAFAASAAETIESNGSPFSSVLINGSGSWVLQDSMTVISTMTLIGGVLDSGNNNVSLGGSWWNVGGTFLPGISVASFTATTAQKIRSDGNNFTQMVFNGTGGSWVLQDSMTVTSTVTLNAGTLNTGSQAIGLGGDWLMTNPALFTINQSTLSLTGGTGQRVNTLGQNLHVIIDSNTNSGGVIFASSFTAYSLTVNSDDLGSATTVYFNAGSTFTITNLSLTGNTGQRVWMRSTTDGTQWMFNNTGSNYVSYVDVQDSDAKQGLLIRAGANSLNILNNENWDFGGSGVVHTWWGTSSSNWFIGTNWENGAPAPQDSVLIVSTATTMPVLTAPVTISSLTINMTPAKLTLNGNGVTLSSFTNAGALVLVGTETLTAIPNNLAGSTVTYNSAGASIVLSSWVYANLQITGGANTVYNITIGTVTVNGALTLTSGALDSTPNNYGILLSSSWWNTGGAYNPRASTVTLSGSLNGLYIRSRGYNFGNIQISGSGYWVLADSMTVISTITMNSGVLDASSNNFGQTIGGSWVNTGGTFIPNASTTTFTAISPQQIASNGSNFGYVLLGGAGGGSWVLQDSMTVVSTMTLAAGTLDMNNQSGITVGGSWWNTGTNFIADTSTVTFTGTTSQKLRSNGKNFNSLLFSGTGGTWLMQDSMTLTGDLSLDDGRLDTTAGNLPILLKGSWINTGGNFLANASTVTFAATDNQTIESGGKNFSYVLFNGPGGYWTLQDSMTVVSTVTFIAGALDTGADYGITAGGSWWSAGGTFLPNSSTVTFTATTAAQKIRSDGNNFNHIFFNGAGGTWVLQDSMTVVSTMTLLAGTLNTNAAGNFPIWLGGTWWNTGGTFTANGSTVSLTGLNQQLRSRGNAFRNVAIGTNTTGGYVSLFDPLTVTGLNVNAGNTLRTKGLNITISSGIISGELVVSGTETLTNIPALLSGSTVTYIATAGQPVICTTWTYQNLQVNGPGFTYQAKGQLTVNQDLSIPAGTLDMLNSSSVTLRGSWSNTGGNFTARSSTVAFSASTAETIESSGSPFGYVLVNGAGSWVLQDSMTVTSTMTLTGGVLATNDNNLSLGGSWWNVGGTFLPGVSIASFTATTVQKIRSDGNNFSQMVFTGAGGSWVLQDSMTVTSTVTLNAGTLNTNSQAIGLGGDWLMTNPAIFSVNLSTLSLIGSSGQRVNTLGQTLHVIIDSNTTSGGVIFASSYTAYSLMVNSDDLGSATTVYFNAASTFAITRLSLTGASGQNVALRSTSNGTFWQLNNTALNNVSYADVRDSDARLGMQIQTSNSVGLQTLNWNFGGSGVLKTWWGTTNSNWFLGPNWDNGAPGANDSVLIVSTASVMPILTAPITISSLTINAAPASLTLSGNGIMLSSFTNAGTLVLVGTEPVTAIPNNLAGSTVTYNSAGASIVLSSWPYANLQITGAANTLYNITNGSVTVNGAITLTSGGLDATTNNNGIFVSSSWWNTGGAYNPRASTVTFTGSQTGLYIRSRGYNFGHVLITGPGYWTMVDSMTLTSTMTLTAGTLDASSNNFGQTIGGSWANTGGTFIPNASTTTFTAITSQQIVSNGSNFGYVLLGGAGGGSWVLQDSMTVVSTITLAAGTLDMNNQSGITVGGSWWNTGTNFIADASTVTFIGITSQKLRSNGKNFNSLLFRGAGGTWVMQDSMTLTGDLSLADGRLDATAGNLPIWLKGSWTNTGGNFLANASTVTFAATDNRSIESNGINFGYVLFNGSGGYWSLVDSMTVISTMTFNAGTLDAGADYGITAGGSWWNAGGTFLPNGSTVTFTATTAAQKIRSDGNNFNHISFNGTGGTWVLQDSMTVVSTMTLLAGTLNTNAAGNFPIWLGGTWWNTGGTFTANGSTVSLTGLNQQLRSRANAFRNVYIGTNTTGGYVTLFDPLTVTGLNVNAGNTLRTKGLGVAVSSGIISGELVVSGTETITNIPALLTGSTVTYTVSGGVPVIFTTWTYQNLVVNGSGFTYQAKGQLTVNQDLSILDGTLDMLNSSSVTLRGSWLNTGGNFTARISTVAFSASTAEAIASNGSPFGYALFNGAGSWVLQDPMTVTSTMTLTGGVLDSGNNNVSLGGSWWNVGGTFLPGISVASFTATTAQKIRSDGNNFTQMVFNGTGGSWVLQDSMTVTSTVTLNAGTLNTGSQAIGLGGDWLMTNPAIFSVNQSTLNLVGASGQRINTLGQNLHVIVDSNTTSGGVIFASSFTALSLTVDGADLGSGTTLYFNAGSTYTLTYLVLSGAGGQSVWIRSTADGSRWRLNNTGSNDVSFVDVQDSDAQPGLLITALNSVGLNTINWNFGGAGVLRTWWGTTNSNWFIGTNWENGVPAPQDSVLIVSTATTMPILTAAVTISSLTIDDAPASLTLSGNGVTLSSFTNAGTLILVGTEPVTAIPNNFTGSTITYNSAGASIVLSSWTYANLQITGSANSAYTITPGSLTVNGALTLTSGSLDPLSNNQIFISSSWVNTGGAFTPRASTVTLTGSQIGLRIRSRGYNFGNILISGSGYWTLVDSMTLTSTMTLTAGVLDASANNFGQTIGGSWVNSGGTFISNASTTTFTAITSQQIASNGSNFGYVLLGGAGGGIWVLQDSMTVVSTMTLAAGTLDMNNQSGITIGGSWWNTGTNFIADASTITFTGGTSQKLRSNGKNFNSLLFSGAGGTWVMQDSMTLAGNLSLADGRLDTAAGNLPIWLNGSWTNTGGNFIANASTVTFAATNNQSIQSNGINFGYVLFNGAGGYWTLVDSMTVISTVTWITGTLDAAAPDNGMTVGGSWWNAGGTYLNGGSTVTFIATTSQKIRSSGDNFNYIYFNGSGGTWVMQDSMTVISTMTLLAGTLNTNAAGNYPIWLGGTWWNNGGTFTANGSTVSLTGLNQQIRSRANGFRNVYIGTNTTGGYVSLFDPLTVSGLNVTAGNTLRTKGLNITISSGIISGELVVSGTETLTNIPALLNGSTVTYSATAGQPVIFTTWTYQNITVNGTGFNYLAKGQLTVNQDLSILAGTLDMFNSSSVTLQGSWINTGGNFTARTSTVAFSAATAETITSNGSPFGYALFNGAGSWVLQDSMTVISTMTLTGGKLDTSGSDVGVGGSWWNTGSNFVANGSTVAFTATTVQKLRSNGKNFANVFFNGTGGSWVLQDSMTVVSTMTISAGTLDTNSVSINAISLGGDWLMANPGRFAVNKSTVTFIGTSGQTITNLGQDFHVLVDSNTSSGGLIFTSSFTAIKFWLNAAALTGSTTLYFNSDSTYTITSLQLRGSGTNGIWIRPTMSTRVWLLNNISTNTVNYVDVAYSSASAGKTIVAGPTSSDNGGNVNWIFATLSVTLSPKPYDFTSVNLGASTMSVTAIGVTNEGDTTQTYSLSVDTVGIATEWEVAADTPTTHNKFVLQGIFNTTQPPVSAFHDTYRLTSTPHSAEGGFYAGTQSGEAAPIGSTRNLWFMLWMPPTTTTEAQQQMVVTVTASQP